MGLMDSPATSGRLIVTPHPVLVDGQRNQPADLHPGEPLCAFLHRHIIDLDRQDWVVLIGGRAVPREMWPFVYPKHGQVIEARGAVGRSAVALVAMVALTYFTMGAGAGWIAGTFGVAAGGAAAAAIGAGLFMAGSVLINKVLQPKQARAGSAAPSVYSIAAGRNRARHDQPVGLLIGSMAGGRTGANALQLSFASNVRSTQIHVFEVQPDRVYYCEAWAKRAGPAAGAVQLRFQLSDNGALQTYPNFQSLNLSSISETEWTKVSGYIRVAAGKNRAVLQLNSAAATTSATQLLWDDFVLMDVTEAYNAQQTATAAAQATSTLDGKVMLIDGVVTAQGQAITTVSAAAGAADAKAGTAQAAAQAAADAAGAKGKVLYQSAAPAAADRLAQNLWIDTTGNANTPKRWNGSAWVAVTDKAATDAAAAAAAARSVADATASGLSATNAWVQAADGVLNAHTTQINQAQAAIAGKANASAIIELDAKVSANITGGGNLLTNASFSEAGRKPWGFLWNDSGFYQEVEKNYLDPTYWPTGLNSLGFRGPGLPPAGQSRFGLVCNENIIAAQPGKRYIASVYLNGHRCATCCYLAFYDHNGNNVGEWTDPERGGYTLGGYPSLAEMPRQFVSQIAPPTTRTVRMGWRARSHADFGGDPYLWAVRPMLEQVPDNQTQPSPWSAGGSEDHASINLMTDVNGNVSGMQVKNDGTTSEIKLLASVLNVLSPGAVDGLELRDGYLRVWRGNVQRIVGNGFGPDGLMDYFGPNVGAGNASKGIATMWMDVNGNAYWGGALAAGVRRNANQSTSIQTVGNNVQVGPFDTNGGNKNVVVSFQRNISRTKWAGGNTGFVAGEGSNYAVIQVFRQVEGQGEGLWVQFTVGGDVNIFNQLDGSDSAESYWSGSYTLNDQNDGTARRTYRAVVADYGERSVTHQSGSFDTQNVTQSLSLVSIEQ